MQFLEIKHSEINGIDNKIDLCNVEIVSIIKSDGHTLQPAQNVPYFIKPDVTYKRPMNLNLGWEDHIFRYPELTTTMPTKVEYYLMSQLDKDKIDPKTKRFIKNVQFCFRPPALKSIMMLPYNKYVRDKWQLYATKYKGKIYLSVKREPWFVNPNPTPRDTYAFKFRQHIFADTPQSKPITDVPVDQYQRLSAIYHANLGGLSLLYCSEISGVMNRNELTNLTDPKQLRSCQVVIPKLAPTVKEWRKNYRIFDWITQAHLFGAKYFCVGFQDKERPGFISTPVKLFKPDYLAELQPIKPKQCMPFVHKFLLKLQSLMTDIDCPYTTFVFEFDDHKTNIIYDIHEGSTEYSMLSEEFIEFMKRQ